MSSLLPPRHAHRPWALIISRSETMEDLKRLMEAWYADAKNGVGLRDAAGFESYMVAGDWESALHSLERTHGRAGGMQRAARDVLTAAVQCRRLVR